MVLYNQNNSGICTRYVLDPHKSMYRLQLMKQRAVVRQFVVFLQAG